MRVRRDKTAATVFAALVSQNGMRVELAAEAVRLTDVLLAELDRTAPRHVEDVADG